jgi:DNA invertase Pin-like site-specific DNA recombinase
MKIGYARVSTDAQDYASQVEALKAAGCEKIISEKISGVSLDKRSLVRLIEGLAQLGTRSLSRG